MNRLFKFITTALIVVVLLVVAAAAVLPKLINPNDYRDEISKLVQEKSGLTLRINGSIGWSVFPWFGLSLEDITVTGTHNSALGHLGHAEVSVKLLPLLSQQVEMQTIKLDGFELSLIKDKNGKGNWEVDVPVKTVSQTEPQSTQEQNESSNPSLQLSIASVEVTNLAVSYIDQQTNTKYQIDQASLVTGSINNQVPVDFKLQSLITLPDYHLKASISGLFAFNLQDGVYSLDQLNISASPNIKNAETLSLTGNIDIQQSPLKASGELGVTRFNPANLLRQLNIPMPSMASQTAMSSLSFDSQFTTDGKSFKASELALKLDDFEIDGQLAITDLNTQAMTFRFTGNDLNLDNYLPPATVESEKQAPSTEKTEQTSTSKTSVNKEQPLIPEDILRGLTIDGSMKLASLTVARFRFDQPSVTLKAANGKQNISIGSVFYEGNIDLNTSIDVRQQGTPKINTAAALKDISLEAMSATVPALKSVHGLINANANMTTQGQLQSTLTRNLNGKVQFAIDEGIFTSANFDKMVCKGIATIRKKQLEKDDWNESTRFRDLSGTFVVNNGIASNDNLIASLSNLNLKGDGKIDLTRQFIDYHIGLNIRGTESPDSDPACKINEDYVNVTWPVRCAGNIGTQTCGIDSDRLGNTAADILRNEARKHIEDKVKGPVKNLLKGLFK